LLPVLQTLKGLSTPITNEPEGLSQSLQQIELSRCWEIEGEEQIEEV